jgi:hypothetical protein
MSLPFFLVWGLLTLVVVFLVTLPLAEVAIVCLVRGPHAYFSDGVRITHTRPAHFTTGELVPSLPSAIVALGSCALTFIVIGVCMYAAVQFIKRLLGGRHVA